MLHLPNSIPVGGIFIVNAQVQNDQKQVDLPIKV